MQAAEETLQEMGALSADKRHMAAFCTVIAKHPQQCLRYCFHADASPLCPSVAPPPPAAADVPPCHLCGAPRQFELQARANPAPLLAATTRRRTHPHTLEFHGGVSP
jgi:hypothetical protein